MKSHISILLSLIGCTCCASGQLSRPAPFPERRAGRVHASWTVFVHPQYSYALPIPPGVGAIGHPENLSEPVFESADGGFVMSAWGGAFQQSPSEVISAQWDLARAKGGRDINYQRRGSTWFVVSGTNREGIEYYEKFTMSGRHAAFMNIRYPRSRQREFEPWIEEIEDGFGLVRPRGEMPATAPQLRVGPRGRQGQARLDEEIPRGGQAAATKAREPAPRSGSTDRAAEGEPVRPRPPQGSNAAQDSATRSADAPDRPTAKNPPVALKVEGKAGFVYSPFLPDRRMVDVSGIPSGKIVKCPHTLKIFKVP